MPSSRNLLMLAGLGALLATFVLFANVVTRSAGGGALPIADAAPDTATTTTAATTSTSGPFAVDNRGFVDSKARCDPAQTVVAFGRTQRSLVVICRDTDGDYEYRAMRVSDDAALRAAADATDGEFEASTDGAVYTVSPTELVVTSGGKVIYRDTWIDYQEPRFTAEGDGTATPTTTAATTTTTTTTATTTTAQRPVG